MPVSFLALRAGDLSRYKGKAMVVSYVPPMMISTFPGRWRVIRESSVKHSPIILSARRIYRAAGLENPFVWDLEIFSPDREENKNTFSKFL